MNFVLLFHFFAQIDDFVEDFIVVKVSSIIIMFQLLFLTELFLSSLMFFVFWDVIITDSDETFI